MIPVQHTPQPTPNPMLFNEPDNPKISSSHGKILSPCNTCFVGPHESTPKRHLDWFTHFCMAHEHDQQTHRCCYSICSSRPHLAIAAMWLNNVNFYYNAGYAVMIT